MSAEMCAIEPGQVVAVWGAGPVGQFAIASARLMGASRIVAIDRFEARLKLASERAGATDVINYEQADVYETLEELTGGRGPDACIDAVGAEADMHGPVYAYDRVKQALKLETERPIALRQAIRACRNGGVVSVAGVYGGFIDKFPMGAIVNRSLTLRSGQCHVQRYLPRLLELIEKGEIDPSFVVTHRMSLDEAPRAYDMFLRKEDGCEKVILDPAA
jgi:threonine dehydrogenase-like Zn-dependent dehydrogenase